MGEKVIFEFETPEGTILEWEGDAATDPKFVKTKFYQSILKDPSLSPAIAKSQGVDYQSPKWGQKSESARDVAIDQAHSVATGVPKAVTGLAQVPGMLFEAARGTGEALTGKGTDRLRGLAEAAVEPVKTIGQGAMELARPGTTNAPPPGDPRWTGAAEAAGANLAGTAGAGMLPKLPVKAAANKVLDPQSLAYKASQIRAGQTGTIGKNAASVGSAALNANPLDALVRAGQGVTDLARRPVAAGLERTAKWLDADNPLQPAPNLPEEDFVPQAADIDTSLQPRQVALAAEDEARRMANPPMIEEPPVYSQPQQPAPYRNPMAEADNAQWLEQQRRGQTPELETVGQALPEEQIIMDVPEETFASAEPATAADFKMAERAISPSGRFAKASTMQNVPKLLEIAPELKGLPPGPRFDNGLVNAFRRAESEITAAEGSVPRETMIPRKDIVTGLRAVEADLAMKNPTLVPAVSKIRKMWDSKEMPDMIPWEKFVEKKRAMLAEGRAASNSGMRRAYRVLMDASAKVSEPLAFANGQYHIIRKALTDANIDPSSGRRIMDVGSPVKPPLPAPPSKGRFALPL
jgi:hypothetical protein